jgi:hypothetical protein
MIPDEVHSKPVYRRLATRLPEEINILRSRKEKLVKEKKRKSKSVEISK